MTKEVKYFTADMRAILFKSLKEQTLHNYKRTPQCISASSKWPLLSMFASYSTYIHIVVRQQQKPFRIIKNFDSLLVLTISVSSEPINIVLANDHILRKQCTWVAYYFTSWLTFGIQEIFCPYSKGHLLLFETGFRCNYLRIEGEII
jgi:hypothetical protein